MYCSTVCRDSDKELSSKRGQTVKRKWADGSYSHIDISKFIKAGSDATRGKMLPKKTEAGNPAWRGDDASYVSKHRRIYRRYGQPKKCEFCGTTEYHRYEWANITGQYLIDRWDWIRLCVPCHRQQAAGRIYITVTDVPQEF